MPEDIVNINNNPGSLEPKSLLSNIRTLLYGNQNEPRIDYVDSALSRISSQIMNKDARNQAEMLRSTISKTLERDTYDTLPGNMMSDIDTMSRLYRYVNSDEIVDNIPYCAKALKILTDGIISPDDITKQTIQVTPELQSSEESVQQQTDLIKSIIRNLDIDTLIWDVIYETLKRGDQFVEICNYKSKDVPITQSLLSENKEDIGVLKNRDFPIILEYKELSEFSNTEYIDATKSFNLTLEMIEEADSSQTNQIAKLLEGSSSDDHVLNKLGKQSNDVIDPNTDISDVRILLHNPGNVIKIQSKRHRMCLGYLLLPEFDGGYNSYFGGSSGGSSTGRSSMNFGLSSLMPNTAVLSGIDSLYKDMLQKIKKYANNDEIYVNKKEVMSLLHRALSELDLETHDNSQNVPFRVRYIPTNRMEHFMISSQRFFPYGEGIFYKLTFQAKLLIALQTAITIKRISESVDKRIIYIETGLPREARNIIEEMKTTMRKRKFSVDTLGTVGTVPSSITAYEDLYIPQMHGKKFVEFDTLQSNVAIRDVVEELKNFRDTIIAGLDCPPAYLNIEENLSNKSALAFENALFAQTIVSYQFTFSKKLRSLISKILLMTTGKKIKDTIIITFPPPKMLQMERDAEKYDMVARIVQALSDMGVPKEWAVKKYVDLPWDDIKKMSTKSKVDEKITPPDQMDMLGGMGMGMGGMGTTPGMMGPGTGMV